MKTQNNLKTALLASLGLLVGASAAIAPHFVLGMNMMKVCAENPSGSQNASIDAFTTFVVEFSSEPSVHDLKRLKSVKALRSFDRLDKFDSEYFRRTFEIQTRLKLDELKTVLGATGLNVAKVDVPQSVFLSALIPSNDPQAESNDTFLGHQWGLKQTGQVVLREIDDINSERIEADRKYPAMDIGLKGIRARVAKEVKRDLIVAVIDSGIDHAHPDLTKSILRNSAECDGDKLPFKPTQDKDGNGYIGDCMGWNFLSKDEKGDNNTGDDVGHGTHVSGIIAAQIGNGIGIAGVSSNIKILPIKVTGQRATPQLTNKVAKAILYAVKMKADVINFSLGWPVSADAEFLRQAFQEARNAGIVVVTAAGNNTNGLPVFPCSYEGVVCVGSVSLNAEISPFSNFGGHVDILAPGEHIISTYPTGKEPSQFSVKGYEILNGTSQATPYVSAQAAIIKGLIPQASPDEIQARLTMTAKAVKWGEKFALSGSSDLGKALAAKPQPVVQPIFKKLYEVPFTTTERTFAFDLPVKNYWTSASRVDVAIEATSKVIALDQSSGSLGALVSGETKILKISGQILDLEGARDARLKVRITADGVSKDYVQNIVLTRRLQNDPDVVTRPLEITSDINSLNLFSLRAVRENDPYPDYAFYEVAEGRIDLKLLRTRDGQSYREEKAIEIPNAKSLMFALKIDMNYDGKNDYFIGSVATKGKEENAEEYIQYTLLKHDLTPLFGRQSTLTLEIDGGVLNKDGMATLSFMPIQTAQGKVATAVFRDVGQAPKVDENPDKFEFEKNVERPRIYFYEPKLERSTWKLVTRNLDNYAWEKKMNEAVGNRFRTDVEVSALLPQTDSDYAAGRLNMLVRVGESSLKSYRIASIEGEKALIAHAFALKPTKLSGQTFEGATVSAAIGLDQAKPRMIAAPVLTSFYSPILARTSALGINSSNAAISFTQGVEPARKQDHLLGFVRAFTNGKEMVAFYQTKSQLIARTTNARGESYDQEPIDRTSIIGGQLFDSLFYPITKGKAGAQKKPAVYVDMTALAARRSYLWTIENGRFYAPMKLNVEIPSNCKARDPKRFGPEGEYHYVLLCEDGPKKWVLKTLLVD